MTREESIKLTVKSLLEVVQTGAKNIEISVMESYGKITVSLSWSSSSVLQIELYFQNLELSEIEAIVSEIEREKEAGRLIDITFFNNMLMVLKRPSGSVLGWPPLRLDKLRWQHGQTLANLQGSK